MGDWIKHFRRDRKENLSLSLKSPSEQIFIAIYRFQFFDGRSSKCYSANETSNFEGRTSTIMVVILWAKCFLDSHLAALKSSSVVGVSRMNNFLTKNYIELYVQQKTEHSFYFKINS